MVDFDTRLVGDDDSFLESAVACVAALRYRHPKLMALKTVAQLLAKVKRDLAHAPKEDPCRI